MGAIYFDDPCDRPYGPTNPDYEYDGWRERRDMDIADKGVNIFELQVRSDRLTIDVARKQMANDVLRAMLAARPNGAQAQVDAVIALCDAEARK